MRKRTIAAAVAALICSIYTIATAAMVRGLHIYAISYGTGRWLIWNRIPAGILTYAAWIVFLLFLPKDIEAFCESLKRKLGSMKVKIQASAQLAESESESEPPAAPNWEAPPAPVEEGPKFCVSCGAKLEAGQKFCTKCGAQVHREG